MESGEHRYHLEINGIAEGPLSAKELIWKAGSAGKEDVLNFRRDDSPQWMPLEEHLDELRHQASSESSAATPPKLKLKRKSEVQTQSQAETHPPFPTEPPPPPAAPFGGGTSTNDLRYTDDNPPPPPGWSDNPLATVMPANPTFPPQPSAPIHTHAPTPPAPTAPPARVSTLLLASLLITLGITAYVFLLMKQDVSGSARRSAGSDSARELGGTPYAVLSNDDAMKWKAESYAKLKKFSSKAKAEAEASVERARLLLYESEELTEKYRACARAIFDAGASASIIGIKFDPNRAEDIKYLRTLEAAMEIAEPYLGQSARGDMERGDYRSVAISAINGGLRSLSAEFERSMKEVERGLEAELAAIRTTEQEAADFISNNLYTVPPEHAVSASGSIDALGLFDMELPPGDYYLIASKKSGLSKVPSRWAVRFTVKALAENALGLDDGNIGSGPPPRLWSPEETIKEEKDMREILSHGMRLRMTMDSLQRIRTEIERRQETLEKLR